MHTGVSGAEPQRGAGQSPAKKILLFYSEVSNFHPSPSSMSNVHGPHDEYGNRTFHYEPVGADPPSPPREQSAESAVCPFATRLVPRSSGSKNPRYYVNQNVGSECTHGKVSPLATHSVRVRRSQRRLTLKLSPLPSPLPRKVCRSPEALWCTLRALHSIHLLCEQQILRQQIPPFHHRKRPMLRAPPLRVVALSC